MQNNHSYMQKHRAVITLILALLLLHLKAGAGTAANVTVSKEFNGAGQTEEIIVSTSKSVIIRSDKDIGRISLASPEIADILLLSPRQIYLTGKVTGATNLTLWNKQNKIVKVFNVSVYPDMGMLKTMLYKVMPNERNIQVLAAHDTITLSGTVSSKANLATALDLAKLFSGDEDKVLNLLNIGGVNQVMIDVKVAEMSRSITEQFGIDFSFMSNGNFIYTMINQLFIKDDRNGVYPITPWQQRVIGGDANNLQPSDGNLRLSQDATGAFRISEGSANLMGFLNVLKENGLVKLLAEPTLTCRSGERAEFLAGGEVPIPVPQGLGTVAIEYKPFGVALTFAPLTQSDGKISLNVNPEVSELDFSTGAVIEGFPIPSFNTRRASTTVELRDGQSFAIAGLLRDNFREVVDKYPVLGEIPILGTLFRSSGYQKSETELIIIVTPHLAKPLDMAKQELPTDKFVEPERFKFFLLGQKYGDKSHIPSAVSNMSQLIAPEDEETGFEGTFGHLTPQ
jgi:pilus assembly protein CpaC